MAADPDDREEGGCRRRREIRPTRGVDGWTVGGRHEIGRGRRGWEDSRRCRLRGRRACRNAVGKSREGTARFQASAS
jgi:hypothetical protein